MARARVQSKDTDGQGDDYIYVREITFVDDMVRLSDGPAGPPPQSGDTGYVHIIFPSGETSFTNTGTHFVDRNGRLLVSSSERWSQDRRGRFSYETRVDECAPTH